MSPTVRARALVDFEQRQGRRSGLQRKRMPALAEPRSWPAYALLSGLRPLLLVRIIVDTKDKSGFEKANIPQSQRLHPVDDVFELRLGLGQS